MEFKMITLSEKEVGRIAGNAGAHAELIATDLSERWRSQIREDQQYVDIYQVQLCVRHDLHRLRGEIAEIEDRHLGRLESASLSREVRNETIPQLRGQLIGIQNLFEGGFGAGTSTKVFGPRTTSIPLDPFPLRRLGNRAHRRLTHPDFVLPVSQLAGVKVVPLELAKSFEVPLTRLDQVLIELEDTLPISNVTLEEKIRTLADLRREAGVAARFLEALYFLARHEELARRVRQSSHRPRVAGGQPALGTGQPALGTGQPALGTGQPALGTGQPPVSAPDSADPGQQDDATATPPIAESPDEEAQTGSPTSAEAT